MSPEIVQKHLPVLLHLFQESEYGHRSVQQ
ncbi:uncharacterized protein METZ01_LOCUS274646 [marine metagenome]|uniref:Uncharacterized protein n=1 Tax=marine metagenome TaxID=408172 RepID=A0A382KEJ5_9ZZZZ